MGWLNKIARQMFRTASLLNTAGHLASGDPKRIVKHIIRKAIFRQVGRRIR